MKKKTITILVFIYLLPFVSNSQQSLELTSCTSAEYEINDHSDADGDGNVCEAKIVLSNSAYYTNNEECPPSNIKWTVMVDLNADGMDDIEYSSSLPSDDTTLDDTNGNGIPDLYIPMTISGEVQSIQLPDIEGPISNHSVRWSVSDDCDLGALCVTNFSVIDRKSPTPFCVSLSQILYDDYETVLYAEDFNIGVFDNCTAQEDIRISFSKDSIVPTRMITCDDFHNSPVLIKIYFWDDSDNIDFCTAYVTVILGLVDCFSSGIIDGIVRDWKGNPLEGVEVSLDADIIEYPLTTLTDSLGRYSFGYHEGDLNYRLSAFYEDSYISGVSTLDLVMIVRHILGLESFINPYQIISADINGDTHVKANDLTTLRKLILGVISEITTNLSWTFLRSDYEFINPMDPFPQLLNPNKDPYAYEFDIISVKGYDFIGAKTGDVSN